MAAVPKLPVSSVASFGDAGGARLAGAISACDDALAARDTDAGNDGDRARPPARAVFAFGAASRQLTRVAPSACKKNVTSLFFFGRTRVILHPDLCFAFASHPCLSGDGGHREWQVNAVVSPYVTKTNHDDKPAFGEKALKRWRWDISSLRSAAVMSSWTIHHGLGKTHET